jgi:N-acetylmuramoyl-L-alanine amidase
MNNQAPKIYVEKGHAEPGKDPGAVNGNLVESEMNVVSAEAMTIRLRYHGAEVMLEDGMKTIEENAKAANAFGADIVLSQHYNGGGGDRGIAIYSIRDGSEKLADAVLAGLQVAGQTNLKKYTKLNTAGTADYFGILRLVRCPAVIIEPCFIDNAADRQLADTIAEQKYIGECVADAIAEAYGFKKEEPIVNENNTTLDNKPDSWAKDAVEWALKNGILKGDDKGNLKLHAPCSRQEMIIFLYRRANLKK